MYLTRIKQWKINKNYRAEEKEAFAACIVNAKREQSHVSGLTYNNRPLKVDRILRHNKAQLRKQRTQMSTPSHDDSVSSAADLPSRRRKRSNQSTNVSTATSSASSQQRLPSSLPSPAPVRSLHPPTDGTDTELILHQTKNFVNVVSGIPIQHADPSSPSITFWTDIKSAFYFLKKHSPQLAWPLLNAACHTPISVLISSPFTFLRELFSTLSPVHTKMHSLVRITLLRYLRQFSLIKIGAKHPITIIISQLELDPGTRHVSETSLRYLHSLHEHRQQVEKADSASPSNLNLPSPQPPSPNDLETFDTSRHLTILLRRDHDLASALSLGHTLITTAPTPSHRALAMTEVVHILSDMCDYTAALTLGQQVIDLYRAIQKEDFPDSRASYAMENMAELSHFRGEVREEERWLRCAVRGARKSRGAQDASTVFVEGKLRAVLEGQGRGNEMDEIEEEEVMMRDEEHGDGREEEVGSSAAR